MYDIIIIGAGPAGLTAAIYGLRANKKVLVLEAKAYGGQIINANLVENYPGAPDISGFDLATNMYNQVKNHGGIIKYETVLKIDKDNTVVTNKKNYQGKTIIIATGSENRKLNLPNEEDFVGKGVSYCATCDGNFYKGKTVAVTGGGNTALEDALYLSNICEKVYVIHRRDTFKGEAKYLNKLKKKENVEFILNANVTKLNGKNKITSITVQTDEKELEIKINGLFIAIGQQPKNEIFTGIVELDEHGYIISEDGVHTKTKNIYVAGDARVKNLRQLTTAVSDGSIAATTALREMGK